MSLYPHYYMYGSACWITRQDVLTTFQTTEMAATVTVQQRRVTAYFVINLIEGFTIDVCRKDYSGKSGIQERRKHVFVPSPRYCTTSPYWDLTPFNLCLQWLRFLFNQFLMSKTFTESYSSCTLSRQRVRSLTFLIPIICPFMIFLGTRNHIFGLNIRVNVVNWYDLQYRVFICLFYFITLPDTTTFVILSDRVKILFSQLDVQIHQHLFVSARASHTCVNDESYYRHLHWRFRSVMY